MFGGDPGFAEEFQQRFVELGTAIAKELNLPPQEAINLDEGTVLGIDSQRLFDGLKVWLRFNGVP